MSHSEPYQGEPKVEPREVLVVEDDPGLRELLEALLEELGLRVTSAADGRRGLEVFLASPERWRVVLLDLVLPDTRGAEVIRAVREARGDLPVVVMSGHRPEVVSARLEGEQVYAFLAKPFVFEDLEALFLPFVEG